jgi:hypothetical protein
MGPMGCPDTSVRNYQYTLRNILEERRTNLHRGGSLKTRTVRVKADSHMPCRAHVVPLLCRAALIHTCHAAPLPFSVSAVPFVKVRVVAGNIRTASPTVQRIGMLLVTTFVELRVVAGRSRTRAGRPHAVSGRPMIIHTCHAHTAPMPLCVVALRSRFQNGMVVAWHGRGMAWG